MKRLWASVRAIRHLSTSTIFTVVIFVAGIELLSVDCVKAEGGAPKLFNSVKRLGASDSYRVTINAELLKKARLPLTANLPGESLFAASRGSSRLKGSLLTGELTNFSGKKSGAFSLTLGKGGLRGTFATSNHIYNLEKNSSSYILSSQKKPAASSLSSLAAGNPQPYSMTVLPPDKFGAALDMNASGQIVGISPEDKSGGTSKINIYSGGRISSFSVPLLDVPSVSISSNGRVALSGTTDPERSEDAATRKSFLYADNALLAVDPSKVYPTLRKTTVTKVNRRGQVVGTASYGDYALESTPGPKWGRGFLWESGVVVDLGTLQYGRGEQETLPHDINDNMIIVGASGALEEGFSKPFVWTSANGLSQLPLKGNMEGAANCINNKNVIVGVVHNLDNYEAAHVIMWRLSSNGREWVANDIGTPQIDFCYTGEVMGCTAEDINDNNEVALNCFCRNDRGYAGFSEPFIYHDSYGFRNASTLLPAGNHSYYVDSINNAGSMLSIGRLANMNDGRFLATPPALQLRAGQNPVKNLDVNHDGLVNSSDVSVLADFLQRNGQQAVPANTPPSPRYFLDADGDNMITSLDLVAVIKGQ